MSNDDFDDEIKEMVYEIHGDVKKINQHLENLNGKVERHEEDLDDLEQEISNNSRRMNIATGVALAISTGAGILATYASGLV